MHTHSHGGSPDLQAQRCALAKEVVDQYGIEEASRLTGISRGSLRLYATGKVWPRRRVIVEALEAARELKKNEPPSAAVDAVMDAAGSVFTGEAPENGAGREISVDRGPHYLARFPDGLTVHYEPGKGLTLEWHKTTDSTPR